MDPVCFNCKKPLPFALGGKVSRNEECLSCRSDVRCCYNCKHYDPNSYNECRENQADRALEKNRANYCDYFALGVSGVKSTDTSKEDTLKKLNDLFK
ncbi:MAG: hypothetical protein IT292_09200 [Deltaproteobacteria bacterium]|nr:hypothetical protein [Deltaproteobacteria bacterium]